MTRLASSSARPLRITDISRAIHLDFEGFKDAPPCLAGVQIDGEWSATVFGDVAPHLVPAAKAKGLAVSALDRFLERLVDQAVDEDRRIAGFSDHERRVLCDRGLGELEDRYVNTLKLARKWRGRHHPRVADSIRRRRGRVRHQGGFNRGKGNTLVDFARLAGWPQYPAYGTETTTARLRHVMGQIERHGDYRSLTRTAKSKWTKLLGHNRWDCMASSIVAELAVSGNPEVSMS